VDDYYSASKNGPPKATFSTPLRGGDDEEPEATQEECHGSQVSDQAPEEQCALVADERSGVVLTVGAGGLSIGRGEDCDVQLTRIEEQQRWGLLPPLCKVGSGSGSFDAGYARLLCRVLAEGALQRNRKGVNRTLSKAAFTLDIDLEPSSPLEAARRPCL